MTVDVDVLLAAEGLASLKAATLGRAISRGFPEVADCGIPSTARDRRHRRSYPGDGQPKPVAFPDPAAAAERRARVALLPLARLVELKLASGMTAPHRLRDLADLLELTRALNLSRDFAARLDPYVREKYVELWRAAQIRDPE